MCRPHTPLCGSALSFITYLFTPCTIVLDKLTGSSASQEIPLILCNPKVHYRIHNCPPPVPILIHIDLLHVPTSNFLKIYLNIIFPSRPGSSMWSVSPRFTHQTPVYTSPLPIRATGPVHLILLDFITRTILGDVYIRSWFISFRPDIQRPRQMQNALRDI